MSRQQPNIIYIHSHDSGRVVQPYGAPVESPNLQRLAEDGIVFRRAFASSPACSPSRASLLTGQSAHSAGMLGLQNMGFRMPSYENLIVRQLAGAGYLTVLAGIQHIGQDGEAIGYERVLTDLFNPRKKKLPGAFEAHTLEVTEEAVGFLRDPPQQPFFLDVGYGVTHRPYNETDARDDPRWLAPPPSMPDHPQTREDFAGYRSLLRSFDAAVGRVLVQLRDSGLEDNTLVIATTDHGLPWPGMKVSLLDSGIGVFLIVAGLEKWRGGHVLDALVSQVDLYPTICDVVGIPIPPHVEGTSLVPLIDGTHSEVRQEVFAEVNYHVEYEPQRCVRTDRWKYIQRYAALDGAFFTQHEPSPSRDVLDQAGYFDRPYEPEQLFDTLLDPTESNNLVDDARYRDILTTLRSKLSGWQQATHDPLLTGDVSHPPDYPALREEVLASPGWFRAPRGSDTGIDSSSTR